MGTIPVTPIKVVMCMAALAFILNACGSSKPGLTICEAATEPIGTEVRVTASFKHSATFGMAGSYCGEAPDPDVNPLMSVRLESREPPLEDRYEAGDVVTVVGTLTEVFYSHPAVQPWIKLTDATLDN